MGSPNSVAPEGLLQDLPVSGRRDDLLQNLAALGLGRPHVAADIRQLRAGGIGNGILVGDTALDGLLQETVSVEGQKQMVNSRLFRPVIAGEVLLGTPGGGQ